MSNDQNHQLFDQDGELECDVCLEHVYSLYTIEVEQVCGVCLDLLADESIDNLTDELEQYLALAEGGRS